MPVLDLFKLDGRRALVTGGGRGIGRSIALALAEAGADVAVTARTQKQIDAVASEIKGRGRRSLAIPCDVRKTEEVNRCVEKTIADLGGLEILVNNAGILFHNWLVDTSDKSWHDVLDTNLTSAFLFTRAAGKHFIQRKGGNVINLASAAGIAASPRQAPYHASKAGMLLMTKSLALEWNRYNIRVNAIAPGFFDTDMTKPITSSPKMRDEFIKRIPLRRLGKPEEIGPLAVFLASDASSYITGEVVVIDGGVTAY
ncbi:MAG: SDR family oxidoreductase [Euryarchaeota archaeon]|nr:SDR family oxidoreductase [Euryarchaeota archaeon]